MYIKKNIKTLLMSAVTAAVGAFCQPVFSEQVDLLLLYDDFTADRYDGNPAVVLNSWVENANAAYAASQVDIQLNLVGLELFNPSSTGIADKLGEIRTSAEVGRLRDQYGADFVSLIAPRDGGICGIGNLAVNASRAFNVTGIQCGYLTLIHELGHNMGLGHSRRQGSRGVRFGYALGYGVDSKFATVMAYPQEFGTRNRLNRFSDPGTNCEGVACGVAIGSSQEADAHTALNNVRFDIADFRDSVGGGNPTTPTPTPVTPTPVTPTPTPTPVVVDVPAPSNLSASAATTDSVNLTWSDNSTNEDFFAVQRSTSSNNGFSQVGTVGRGNTSFVDQNLSPGTYFYRVQASKQGVLSGWAATANVTLVGNTEPTVPPVDGSGLNLLDVGFRVYTTQTGSDARGFISRDGGTVSLMNNLWAATTTTFEITPSTVLSFDYSSDVSGEIHGIGMEENDQPSQDRIFKLGGTQNWGNTDYEYTGGGDIQRFDIPVGQYYTGNMRLVIVNDNDAGSGNSGYFSNIRITDGNQDVASDESGNFVFGLEYLDDSTAILFHNTNSQTEADNTLCLNSDCAPGVLNNGRFERQVDANVGEDYLIEFRVQKNQGECSTSSIVVFDTGSNGQADSPCSK